MSETMWIADLAVCKSGHVASAWNEREVPAVRCRRNHLMPADDNYCMTCGVSNPSSPLINRGSDGEEENQ